MRLGASWPVLFTCLCLHTPQLVAAPSLSGVCFAVFSCSHGRTSEHAAASWHHRVESLFVHGHSALRTTLSPTATMWCELSAPCAVIGLHTGATRCSDSKLCVLPTGYTKCHQSTSSEGSTRTGTSDSMSATLAEAATQLSFAEFLERCILEIPRRPRCPPTPYFWTQLRRLFHTSPPPNSGSRNSLSDVPTCKIPRGPWFHLRRTTFSVRRVPDPPLRFS